MAIINPRRTHTYLVTTGDAKGTLAEGVGCNVLLTNQSAVPSPADRKRWRQVTAASKSRLARRYDQDLSMGLGRAGVHPEYPGVVSERYISENNQRLFYRRWEEFMNAESWADIPIAPITARFDGTATIRG